MNYMKFVSDEHEKFYNNNRSITQKGRDFEALVYTLGITEDCSIHFYRMYDDKERCIIPDVLFEGWQTGASQRITRLAFTLFTGTIVEGDDPNRYCPTSLFYCLDEIHRQGALLALAYFA